LAPWEKFYDSVWGLAGCKWRLLDIPETMTTSNYEKQELDDVKRVYK